jgi:ABC-type methionine transport system ATPase subunit
MTAVRNVEMPLILAGEIGSQRKKHAEHLLEEVGLFERRNHRLSELSGGEQQRVAISVALANSPKLLLADEPTGEVDEATALVIYNIFRQLNQELKLTTLIVSHDTNLARHVDRVIAIRDGKISSEIVRQAWAARSMDDPLKPVEAEHVEKAFQELAVLDSAGRLQIPKDYLEKFEINGRAQLELTEDGILVRAAPQAAPTQNAEELVTEMIQTKKVPRFQKLSMKIKRRFGGTHGNPG